jgi:F420-dependent methylenetetrahydromethanopterin dehydrogenase
VATSAAAYARLLDRRLPDLAAAHELLADGAGLAVRARQQDTARGQAGGVPERSRASRQ